MSAFRMPLKVMFQHCDPHGIVFYPRYFEMVNTVVETWFDEALGYSFARMQLSDGRGVPLVAVKAQFPAISRLGEVLDMALEVIRLGRSSADLRVSATCDGEVRLKVEATMVLVDKAAGRSMPWPHGLREAMERSVVSASQTR